MAGAAGGRRPVKAVRLPLPLPLPLLVSLPAATGLGGGGYTVDRPEARPDQVSELSWSDDMVLLCDVLLSCVS